jgi:hypothetical protein
MYARTYVPYCFCFQRSAYKPSERPLRYSVKCLYVICHTPDTINAESRSSTHKVLQKPQLDGIAHLS